MNRFFIYFVHAYVYVSSLMVSSENMYGTKALLMGYSMRLELTCVCSFKWFLVGYIYVRVYVYIYIYIYIHTYIYLKKFHRCKERKKYF